MCSTFTVVLRRHQQRISRSYIMLMVHVRFLFPPLCACTHGDDSFLHTHAHFDECEGTPRIFVPEVVVLRMNSCLQCFDAVGFAAGRASGL